MRNVIKKSFCVIMVIFFLGLQFNSDIYASQSRNSANSESLKIETSIVPQEAIDYAKDISANLLANVVGHTIKI